MQNGAPNHEDFTYIYYKEVQRMIFFFAGLWAGTGIGVVIAALLRAGAEEDKVRCGQVCNQGVPNGV